MMNMNLKIVAIVVVQALLMGIHALNVMGMDNPIKQA